MAKTLSSKSVTKLDKKIFLHLQSDNQVLYEPIRRYFKLYQNRYKSNYGYRLASNNVKLWDMSSQSSIPVIIDETPNAKTVMIVWSSVEWRLKSSLKLSRTSSAYFHAQTSWFSQCMVVLHATFPRNAYANVCTENTELGNKPQEPMLLIGEKSPKRGSLFRGSPCDQLLCAYQLTHTGLAYMRCKTGNMFYTVSAHWLYVISYSVLTV